MLCFVPNESVVLGRVALVACVLSGLIYDVGHWASAR
jgi:hypothetical protein